ncbi:Ku70/Ku80 C-terminal arm [Geosmithia morbida]|uniref:Ku70/Ku80 C-terminal arm n=1 Tax=Geosmithia morbida TaxID=1094350 RepID=A0A9P4Z243_9HYPO|nr:Ku70/Ku80 C-terminal arm [Geosmithia morbida]KAF4125249.1 Ku70/Ku80 C-terminal arm [Geosmithia morbida]
MVDFLESFDFGTDAPRQSNDSRCASVDEMVAQLRVVLEQKVTETRAEHVSVAYELRTTTKFTLVQSDSEEEDDNTVNVMDTLLSGGAEELTTVVSANQVIVNQTDDPARQRAVGKNIIRAVAAADGSCWVLRGLSRGRDGWTLRYACGASYQEWIRQSAKNPPKTVVGAYSFQVPDPALMDRPAFDCRGSISVCFNRGNHSITVQYSHTLMHQTVGQLKEKFPVRVREPGPGYQRQLEIRNTPKKQKKPRSENPRGDKRERPWKSDGDKADRPRKRKRDKKTAPAPVVPMGDAISVEASSSSQQQGQQPAVSGQKDGNVPLVSVSAEEAARRLATARELLFNAGVDPDTLSTEQMNIFANQAPNIQKDSVAMLAKYGAQQLQIVHPQAKARSQSQQQQQQQTDNGSNNNNNDDDASENTTNSSTGPVMTTQELALGGGVEEQQTENGGGRSTKQRKVGKSRVSCYQCKSRRAKCPKDRPSCSECQSTGQSCEYPLQKPRKRESEAAVAEGDNGDGTTVIARDEQQPRLPVEEEQGQYDAEEHDDTEMEHQQLPPLLPEFPAQLAPQPQPTPHSQSVSGLALPLANLSQQQRTSMSPQMGGTPDMPTAHASAYPRPAPDRVQRQAHVLAGVSTTRRPSPAYLRYNDGGSQSGRRTPIVSSNSNASSDITYKPFSHQQAMMQQRDPDRYGSHGYSGSDTLGGRDTSSPTLSDPMAAMAQEAATKLPQNAWASTPASSPNDMQRGRTAAAVSQPADGRHHSYGTTAGHPQQQTQAPYYDPFSTGTNAASTAHGVDLFGVDAQRAQQGKPHDQQQQQQGAWNFYTQSGRGFL